VDAAGERCGVVERGPEAAAGHRGRRMRGIADEDHPHVHERRIEVSG
jgi:hypothetical protein